jgi:hypothetical protein
MKVTWLRRDRAWLVIQRTYSIEMLSAAHKFLSTTTLILIPQILPIS